MVSFGGSTDLIEDSGVDNNEKKGENGRDGASSGKGKKWSKIERIRNDIKAGPWPGLQEPQEEGGTKKLEVREKIGVMQ